MKKVLLIVAVVMVMVMLATIFVACSAESYQKQLEKKDYSVSTLTSENKIALAAAAATYGVKGDVEFIVTGVKKGSTVTYIGFEKSSDAKDYANKLKDSDKSLGKVTRSGKTVKIVVE